MSRDDERLQAMRLGSSLDSGGDASASPCSPWITGADVATLRADQTAPATSGDLDVWAGMASDLLYQLSGGVYAGSCAASVRPCRQQCMCAYDVFGPQQHVVWLGGRWACGDDYCGCGVLSRVKLAGWPVQSIDRVRISGEDVDPATYRLDEHRWLTRLSGNGGWPACQDLGAGDDDPGAFVVTYRYGAAPPAAGVQAALDLAVQLYKGSTGGACALPSSVTQIARQGVTMNRKVGKALAGGQSGIATVDAFLATYNPTGMRVQPAVWSPDTAQFARNI